MDPGLPRFQQLLRIYDLPLDQVADLLDFEISAVPLPGKADPRRLYEEATELWKAGKAQDAFARMAALRLALASAPDQEGFEDLRERALLQFGVVAAGMGRHELAKRLAEELLGSAPERSVRLRALVQLACSCRHLGNLELASAALDRAAVHLKKGDPEEQALLTHQRGLLELSASPPRPRNWRPADGVAGRDVELRVAVARRPVGVDDVPLGVRR